MGCAAALALAACGSSGGSVISSSASSSGSAAAGGGVAFNVAVVPSITNEPLNLALQRGYIQQAGLNVHISTVDSGPALLTGVLNGAYDAGFTALFPLVIAFSKGAPLKTITTLAVDAPAPGQAGQSALIVKKGSPVKRYRDLAGKTVATNALTSLTTLATEIAIRKQGGNPNSMKIVSMPFDQAVQAVDRGQVDAAVVISPFSTQAVLDGLTDIGDPIGTMMPPQAPYTVGFTSAQTASSKASEIASFRKAILRAEVDLRGNTALQRQIAQSVLGYSAALAEKVALPNFTSNYSLKDAQTYNNLIAQYGYTKTPVNASTFPG
jgi:NitT/TauT family transport system substrate-binding protein